MQLKTVNNIPPVGTYNPNKNHFKKPRNAYSFAKSDRFGTNAVSLTRLANARNESPYPAQDSTTLLVPKRVPTGLCLERPRGTWGPYPSLASQAQVTIVT